MKDIYSPLEIDEEWDNLAPVAEGTATATNPSTDVANNQPLPGLPSTNLLAPEEVTYNDSAPDSAYNAAEALIDNSEQDTKPDTAAAANSGDTFTSGLVKITPDKPTSDEPAPETPITGTPHKFEPVKINVMGDDSNDTLPYPIDQSNGGTSSPEVPVIAPYIAPFKPEEMLKDKGSDDAIGTGTITPGTIKASDDDGGESSSTNSENSASSSDDDTENPEADTSAGSSDTVGKSSETKSDKAKEPSSTGASIHRLFPDDEPYIEETDDLAGDKLNSILNAWEDSKRKYKGDLEKFREFLRGNTLEDDKVALDAKKVALDAKIAKREQLEADVVARLKELDVL